VGPEETEEFERAVNHARERLEDLSALMVVANDLDQRAERTVVDKGTEQVP
jgi:hypothetical protein